MKINHSAIFNLRMKNTLYPDEHNQVYEANQLPRPFQQHKIESFLQKNDR